MGAELEADLANRLAFDNAMAGDRRIRNVRLSGDFGNVGVELELPDDEPISLYLIAKQTNPVFAKQLEEAFKRRVISQDEELSINLNVRDDFHIRRSEIAIYQSAFLLMFRHFGYEYVLNPRVAELREQLLRPDEHIWSVLIKVTTNLSPSVLPENRSCAVMLLPNPPAAVAILRLRSRNGPPKILGVPMPWLQKQPHVTDLDLKKISGSVINYKPRALMQKWFAHWLWNNVQRAVGTG